MKERFERLLFLVIFIYVINLKNKYFNMNLEVYFLIIFPSFNTYFINSFIGGNYNMLLNNRFKKNIHKVWF